jgi:hypothetical protein
MKCCDLCEDRSKCLPLMHSVQLAKIEERLRRLENENLVVTPQKEDGGQ